VKSQKFAGSGNPSWNIVRRNITKIKDIFPFLTLMAVRQGLERNECWAAAWDWKLNVFSIVLIYIQQQMGFILKYPVLTVSVVLFIVHTEDLYCIATGKDWLQEHLGLSGVNVKFLEKGLGKEI